MTGSAQSGNFYHAITIPHTIKLIVRSRSARNLSIGTEYYPLKVAKWKAHSRRDMALAMRDSSTRLLATDSPCIR